MFLVPLGIPAVLAINIYALSVEGQRWVGLPVHLRGIGPARRCMDPFHPKFQRRRLFHSPRVTGWIREQRIALSALAGDLPRFDKSRIY